jgi:transketolase
MNANDRPMFVATLAGLAAVKPGAALTVEAYEIFWAALREWEADEFRAAAAYLAKTIEFMPNPYHFEQLRKASGETAAEAWTRVLAAVRSAYPDQRISVDGKIDRIVRALGGYRSLAMMPSSEMHFRARDFANLWQELSVSDDARAVLPALAPPDTPGPQPVRTLLAQLRTERS